jgi:hypothetical protein
MPDSRGSIMPQPTPKAVGWIMARVSSLRPPVITGQMFIPVWVRPKQPSSYASFSQQSGAKRTMLEVHWFFLP